MVVYFDHNATTRVHSDVLQAMAPYLDGEYGNASCLYSLGVQAGYALEKARLQTARSIGARDDEIVFTGGGTESDNLALMGVVFGTGKKQIVTSAVEHPAVLKPCEFMAERMGCCITLLPVDSHGFVNPKDVAGVITNETALVSVMAANNEIGSVQNVEEIAKVCRERSVCFHTDAVQAAGRISIDVRSWGVDLLSLSAHKIYGPKGVGALYIRSGVPFVSTMPGGGQESGRRAGTENIPAIVGMGKAAELARLECDERARRESSLRDLLWENISALGLNVQRNSPAQCCLPGTLNVSIPGIDAREFVRAMDAEGYCIAAGSACSTGKSSPSYVLRAIGRDDSDAISAVRISLGRENTKDEIDRFITIFPNVVERLKKGLS